MCVLYWNTRMETHTKRLEKKGDFWLKFPLNIAFWLYSVQKFTWFWQRQAKIWFYFFFSLAWSRIVHFTKEYPPPLFTAFTAVSVAELPLLAFCRRRRDKVCVQRYSWISYMYDDTEKLPAHTGLNLGPANVVHSLPPISTNSPRKCDNTLHEEAVAHVSPNTHAPNQSISCRSFDSTVYTAFQYTRLRDSCAIDVIPQLFTFFLLIHIQSHTHMHIPSFLSWECSTATHTHTSKLMERETRFPRLT